MSAEMESQSLAVKYRPKSLKGLVGQEHIVSAVSGMLKTKKIPAAIMLYGSTGLGKTTTARIIARYINCENPDEATQTPCGECRSCKMREHPDVTELNAADSRSIDDVRNLISLAKNRPAFGNKRFIIVDEAHQLPSLSQDALLKPLEEPCRDTIWIICTMTPEKMKQAIAGRCTRLQVKPVEPEVLRKRLAIIAKREGVDLTNQEGGKEILTHITDRSCGSIREAISALEPIIYALHSNKKADLKAIVASFANSPEAQQDQQAADVLASIIAGDLNKFLSVVYDTDSIRGLLSKLRWLIDFVLAKSVNRAKFTPYSGRLFSALVKKQGLSVKLLQMLEIQNVLCDAEVRMNSFAIEERVVFSSMLGNYISNRSR